MSHDVELLVYGATGFTGRQAAARLAAVAPPGVRIGLAGRRRDALEAVAAGLGREVRLFVADSTDPASVDAAVSRARVVLSTAGPFARYGDPVVDAAVRHRVDYVDITGETPWIAGQVARHHAAAAAAGVRIVPCCGFDSVPSDLGAWMVTRWIHREWGQATTSVLGAFSASGGFNGGTIASALGLSEAGAQLPRGDRRSRAERAVRYEPALDRWLTPFFMAPVNTWVVGRTLTLLDAEEQGYGADFTYREAMEVRGRARAEGLRLGLGLFAAAMSSRTGRRVVRRLAPAPGEGPSEASMNAGFFRARLLATAADGRRALGVVSDRGDPGNRATVKMLTESALALLLDRDALPGRAGVLTPAAGLGDALLTRLRAAGMTWTVAPLEAP